MLLSDRNHPNKMSSGTPSAPPAPPSGTGTGTTGSSGGGSSSGSNPVLAVHIKTAAASVLYMPSGTQLEVLSGQNWSLWSGVLTALLQLNEVDAVLTHDTLPSGVDPDDWASVQKKTKAYLRLYCAADVHSTVESDVDFPTFKEKYKQLKETYGSVGSTAIFNLWIELTQARLDDGSPLAPQLAKLNEARVKLSNAGMGVSDTQYCLILLNALPNSYEVVASTLLASGPASNLKYSEITARVLNEEGRKSGPSASLNAARAGKNKNLTCHYCNKKGHMERDCRKKKKDEAEKEEEDSSSSDSSDSESESEKAANALVYVPATADNGLNVYL